MDMLVFSEVNKSDVRKSLFTHAILSHDLKKKKTVTHVTLLDIFRIYLNIEVRRLDCLAGGWIAKGIYIYES